VEMKSCYACHAPQTTAVPNVGAEALKHGPVKITRHVTDLEYRRNDPDGYCTQARFGEAPLYWDWLASKDPELRARACTMLMYVEDLGKSVRSDAKNPDGTRTIEWQDNTAAFGERLVELLHDPAVEVRRAAALALTRFATPALWKDLQKASKDP